MRQLIAEIKSLVSNLPAGSWAKALGITLVCLVCLIMPITISDSLALLYLQSFDRDPRNWTNLVTFYSRPEEDVVSRGMMSEPVALGSVIVRGKITNLAYTSHYNLTIADLKPSVLHDCLLAAEDGGFYSHTGLSYVSILKAVYDYFVRGTRLRGASTISNQLIRTVILADQSRSGFHGLLRKVAEIALTGAAERHFSKDKLLLAYVNSVPVGHMDGRALIGLAAASEALFGKKNPKALTLSDACVLAGMLNRPNRYLRDAARGGYRQIRARRDKVLERLHRLYPEHYSENTIKQAKREAIRFFNHSKKMTPEPRQFIRYAYQQLESRKPGMQVRLTMDPDLQRGAEITVRDELDRFDRGPYGFYNGLSHRHLIKKGRKLTAAEASLQAALVALDAKTGEILALVGGRNPTGEFNRATQAKRAPGSTVKPFVYLYGIASGVVNGQPFRADTIIDPVKSSVARRYSTGGAARARVQLARSDNGATVEIAEQLGMSRVRDFITKVSGANPVESELVTIGAGKGVELSPLKLASAYTVFPNNGVKVAPRPIWAAYDNGKKINLRERKAVQIVNPGASFIVARMLQSVVGDGPDGHYGTAKAARKLADLESNIALAGKTGTGDNDLWFVGFTPQIVVVVWVGFDNNFPQFEASKGFTGSGLPLQIWARFMRDVKKYRPDLLRGSFDMP